MAVGKEKQDFFTFVYGGEGCMWDDFIHRNLYNSHCFMSIF